MNKTSIVVLITLFITAVAYLSTGCKKNEPTVTEFRMKIDSVSHADTINVGEQFDVIFYGPVGENNCYEFLRFEPAFGTNLIEIAAIAKFTERDDCSGGEQYLQAGVGFTDLTAGEWKLSVLQPDGSLPLESTVVVE